MKIAQALLLRKQLEAKVKQLEPLRMNGDNGVFDMKVERVKVSEEIDEARMQIPKVTVDDITKSYDKYSSALRKLDAAIQEANWKFDLDSFTDKDNPLK